MAFNLASFEADVTALIAENTEKLTSTQIGQIETIAKTTFDAAAADAAAGRDPIPDIVAGLNKIDAIINMPAPCFAASTRIETSEGPKAVEELAVGDLVLTTSGALRPIRWLGHRTIDCRRIANADAFTPIRIAAHAFAENRPVRDLVVSPGHALCVDLLGEVLICASDLVNGATITREEVDTITYWHVELDAHDILLAENLPCESYLDMGNRHFFASSTVVDLAAAPDGDAAQRTHSDFCRPFHADSVFVEVVKEQLRRRLPALGWRLQQREAWDDVALIVDGKRMRPKTRGLAACFELPATARELFLCCPAGVPGGVDGRCDSRSLGLCLAAITFGDGLSTPRQVALDDPALAEGFYGHEGTHRWTGSRARLPNRLLEGFTGTVFLRVDLHATPVASWTHPISASSQDVAPRRVA